VFSTLRGPRPDITPAQALATAFAAVPVAATIARSFGAGREPGDGDALRESIVWSSVVAGALVGGDAIVRAARSYAAVRTEAMAMAPIGDVPLDPDEIALEDIEASAVVDEDLPSDDEELAAPPPAVVS
jgi:hypothetical protein